MLLLFSDSCYCVNAGTHKNARERSSCAQIRRPEWRMCQFKSAVRMMGLTPEWCERDRWSVLKSDIFPQFGGGTPILQTWGFICSEECYYCASRYHYYSSRRILASALIQVSFWRMYLRQQVPRALWKLSILQASSRCNMPMLLGDSQLNLNGMAV